MSVRTPPLPLATREYIDITTERLHLLVTQLVAALASNNPKETVVAISTFVKYFTFVLEVLEKISQQKNNSIDPKVHHNTWAYLKGLRSLKKGMSAQAPPLPLSILVLKDKRIRRLNLLVTRLVTALATNDPQGIVAVIGTFVRYFTLVLETLEKFSNLKRKPSIPFAWVYLVIRKRLL